MPTTATETQRSRADKIRQWITPLSALLVACAAGLGVWQYRINARAEERMQNSARAENNVRLTTLFTEVMRIANARAGSQVSEKCIEQVLSKSVTQNDHQQLTKTPGSSVLNQKISECVIDLPVGDLSQDAAIASLGVLGCQHKILREPARAALNSAKDLEKKKDKAEAALKMLAGNECEP